jgi:hypothetical protein
MSSRGGLLRAGSLGTSNERRIAADIVYGARKTEAK